MFRGSAANSVLFECKNVRFLFLIIQFARERLRILDLLLD